MTRMLGVVGLATALFLGVNAVAADQDEQKEPAKGEGKLSPEEFKRLEEFYKPAQPKAKAKKGKGLGGFDPDQIKKLLEKFGGAGGLDPDQIKKLLERFGKGKGGKGAGGFDPDQIKKLL